MTTKVYKIVTMLIAVAIFSSCRDDFFDFATGDTEGTATVTLDLSYTDFGTTATSRGTAGNAIEGIDEVCVLAYTTDGKFATRIYASRDNGLYDGEAGASSARMRFDLHYGNYRIYAVANMGDLADRADEIATEAGLRSLRFAWNNSVSLNRQMSGTVTNDASELNVNGSAPLVVINRDVTHLHSSLRRAVSKATVAFDATQLRDKVFIYIKSATVRDIPLDCSLFDDNVPQLASRDENPNPASILTDGESINYLRNANDYTSTRVLLARGTAYGGLDSVDKPVDGDNVHRDDEESLFFYENMQGTHPNKHIYNNFESKDNVKYGTYLEVKAYYVNNNSDKPSQGNITYRYMLGMNDTNDFNARRNAHYRVTLKFKGDANDPDWHIDYLPPFGPDIRIPTPLYISYLYNQSLNVPITAYFNEEDYYVKSVTTEIIYNEYTHPAHKYGKVTSATFDGKTYNYTQPKFGFLSLNRIDDITTDITAASNFQQSATFDGDDLKQGVENPGAHTWTFNLPVYTRPLNLMFRNSSGTLSELGFSGNNHFTHRERKATLKVTMVIGSKVIADQTQTVTTNVDIIQVPRVVNPKGAWRPHNSTEPFTFTLTQSESDAAITSSVSAPDVQYTPIRSNGPWTARIYTEEYDGTSFKPGSDWICLSTKGSGNWKSGPDAQVTGSTNSLVEFDFKPKSTIAEGKTRFGVIEVLYHDNQCKHLIFVSQGFGTVQMGTKNWMMGNLYANGIEVTTPVAEGSMFKYGNPDYAILSTNSYSSSNTNPATGAFKDAYDAKFEVVKRTYNTTTHTFESPSTQNMRYSHIGANFDGFNLESLKKRTSLKSNTTDGHTYRVATIDDFTELLDTKRYGTFFGVLYGEGVQSTKLYKVDRFTQTFDEVGYYEQTGMRGCFVYDRATGNHMFLPIGNTGNGRRKAIYNPGTMHYNTLKYAFRDAEMSTSLATPRPLMYDIYQRPGAIYWSQKNIKESNSVVNYGLDINYFTYLVNIYQAKMVYYYGTASTWPEYKTTECPPKHSSDTQSVWEKNSDAAFIRRIQIN